MDSIEVIVTNSDSALSTPTSTRYQLAQNSSSQADAMKSGKFEMKLSTHSGDRWNLAGNSSHENDDDDDSKKPLLSMPSSQSSTSLHSAKKVTILPSSSTSLPFSGNAITAGMCM